MIATWRGTKCSSMMPPKTRGQPRQMQGSCLGITSNLSSPPSHLYSNHHSSTSHNSSFSVATMASTTAQRRLLQEYRALTNNPPEGITAGPISEDDLLNWEALIQGPEGTPFEGGIFPAELKFPKDYPLAPPSMRFLGEVWHPNGSSCLQLCRVSFPALCGTPGSLQMPPY